MTSRRADVALVARGFFPSRAKAAEAIAAGLVTANGRRVGKPSDVLSDDDRVAAQAPYPWVSRGGVKLAAALDRFALPVAGRRCLDIGASTGGFTDVLLARGAHRVVCVDAGQGQLHPRIAVDHRVVAREQFDARKLTASDVAPPPDLVVIDVSFISLSLVLPTVLSLAADTSDLVALAKPQFEGAVNKKGIVRDAQERLAALQRVTDCVNSLGWIVRGTIPSPIAGGDGNAEFLLHAQRNT